MKTSALPANIKYYDSYFDLEYEGSLTCGTGGHRSTRMPRAGWILVLWFKIQTRGSLDSVERKYGTLTALVHSVLPTWTSVFTCTVCYSLNLSAHLTLCYFLINSCMSISGGENRWIPVPCCALHVLCMCTVEQTTLALFVFRTGLTRHWHAPGNPSGRSYPTYF